MKLLPVEKKITYISRESNTIPIDFQLLENEMRKRYPQYKNIILTKMLGNGIRERMRYCIHILRQMYHIVTSEMVILDTYCIAVSVLKQRPNLIVIQMWHALGALKKFGYSILGKEEGSSREIASLMHMHENYTYAFCSSEFCRRFFAEAFQMPEENVLAMPLPRLDLVGREVEKTKEKILSCYPQLETEKEIIVYAPTFRKEEDRLKEAIDELVKKIDHSKYNLVLKLHPLSNITITNPEVIQDDKFSTLDFCKIADMVILDYSAVVFEILLLKKPMFFYVFDYKEYMEERDFYVDYKEVVPGVIVEDISDLLDVIDSKQVDLAKVEKFRELMLKEQKKESYTEEIAEFLFHLLQRKGKKTG